MGNLQLIAGAALAMAGYFVNTTGVRRRGASKNPHD
jgi:hypothetical protein